MDLEIRHLKLVRAVTSAGSLTGAGAVLNLTQSALSHQLRDIESRLGTPLFLRVGKRMMLTPAGERLLRSADEVLEAIERTEDSIRQLSGAGPRRAAAQHRVLHLLPLAAAAAEALPPRAPERRGPDQWRCDVRSPAASAGRRARRRDPERRRCAIGGWSLRSIFSDEMVIIVDPRHPLAGRPFVTAADLATETLLMYAQKEESTIYKLLAAEGIVPANMHVVQLTEAIVELVKAGLGFSFLARWAVEPQVRAGTIRAIPYTRRGYRRTWSAATLKDMARVPYVREFIDLLAEHPPFQGKTSKLRN